MNPILKPTLTLPPNICLVEWWGFALAGNSLTALSFAVYTMVFLTVRGLQNHKWYLEKFDDYPPQRKGVYPFLL